MLGRPDLLSSYGYGMTGPVAGTGLPIGGANQVPLSGASVISGSLTNTVSGNVATGQMSLGMVAAIIVLLFLLYFWTRSHQH
jgi:hypothetical protein